MRLYYDILTVRGDVVATTTDPTTAETLAKVFGGFFVPEWRA